MTPTPDRPAAPGRGVTSRREAVVVAAAALVGLAALAVRIAGAEPEAPVLPLLVDVAVGVAGIAALRLRGRYPATLAAALVLALTVSDLAFGPLVVAAAALGATRRWRPVLGVGALFVASLVAMTSATPGSGVWWGGLGLATAVYVACAAAGAYVGGRRELEAALRAEAAAVREAQSAREQRAVEQERTRIAREMHDVLAHRISLVAMHAGVLAFRTDLPPEQTASTAAVVRDNANLALLELREVLGVLRPTPDGAGTPDRPQPTLADLADLVADARSTAPVDLVRPDAAALRRVPAGASRHAYRIVQEALTNARKHAPGAPVRIVVATEDGSLVVEVGNGAARTAATAPPGSGTGLVGVAERVRLVGGSLEHGPDGSGGYRLRAELPITTGDA